MAALSIAAGAAIVAGVLATGHIVGNAVVNGTQRDNKLAIDDAQKRFKESLRKQGLKDFNAIDMYNDMYNQGYISKDEYTKAVKVLKDIETTTGKGFLGIENQGWKELALYKKTAKELAQLYNRLAEYKPEYGTAFKDVIEHLQGVSDGAKESIINSMPSVASAPAPQYEDVDFEGYQMPVNPVKLWTGQEMADLHSLNFDPNSYYDLVKAGTTADVDAARYMSEQANQASMVDDTANRTSYLDAIRNNKADAIATGATRGARAASELLSNLDAISNYATNQNTVAQDRFTTVDDYLLADAQARLTATKYYENLAKSLSGDSATLYANDTDRFGQEVLSNAEMYAADQALRGQRAYANGSMAGNYAQAQAAVNAARNVISGKAGSAIGDVDNEYEWLFNRFLGANNNNLARTVRDMDDYIFSRYTGKENPLEYVNAYLDNK